LVDGGESFNRYGLVEWKIDIHNEMALDDEICIGDH